MANDISIPAFSIDGGIYKYLASVGFTEEALRSVCVVKAIVTAVDDVSSNTVSIDIDGDIYTDVPVWIHTDCGSRSRLIASSDEVSPSLYFENAALLFPMAAGKYITEIGTSLLDSPTGHNSRDPEVLVMITSTNEIITPVGIIGILDNGVTGTGFDRTATAHQTYKPVMLIKERHGSTGSDYRFSMFDMLSNDWLQVSNEAGTALVEVLGLSATATYDFITDGGFELEPEPYTMTFYCQIGPISAIPSNPSVGDYTYAGSCTCNGGVQVGDPVWECIQADYLVCPPGQTRLQEQTWIPLCDENAGYYYQQLEDSCVTGTGIYYEINDVAYMNDFGFPVHGKKKYTFDNFPVEFERTVSAVYDAQETNYLQITVESGSDSYTFEYNASSTFPITMTAEEIIFDSHGSLLFSFSCIYLMFSTGESLGGFQLEGNVAAGLSFSSFTTKLKERYSDLVTANPSGVTIEIASCFLPYDVNLRKTIAGLEV